MADDDLRISNGHGIYLGTSTVVGYSVAVGPRTADLQ